ncbi:MAG: hypothetical protein JXQ65_03190 [Candidatus Marinimicrobia bacterium]|nr:hypothetical protein [Candidatus Neomarinimicrobiota bacterium]
MKHRNIPVFILIFCSLLFAQSANSVYTLFGVGQIIDDSYGINRVLGGTGIAFHSGTTLNFKNPAAYLGTNQNSFALEIGLYGLNQHSGNGSVKQNIADMNLSYISLSSYFDWWWAFNLGMVPFSNVEYNINTLSQMEGSPSTYEKSFNGTGGLNRMFFGNSFIVNKHLNAGFNLSYIFGSVTQTEKASESTDFSDYQLVDEINAKGVYFDYGLQYSIYKNTRWQYTLGLTCGARKILSTSHDLLLTDDDSVIELENDQTGHHVEIPQKLGLGWAVIQKDHFRLGLDYEFNQWSHIRFNNPKLATRNSHRFSFGLEYGHPSNPNSGLLDRLLYRVGGFYKNSYLVIDNTPIDSWGVNVGFGIPLNKINLLNISLEYGQEGTLANNLVKNNYYGIYTNFSLFEFLAR